MHLRSKDLNKFQFSNPGGLEEVRKRILTPIGSLSQEMALRSLPNLEMMEEKRDWLGKISWRDSKLQAAKCKSIKISTTKVHASVPPIEVSCNVSFLLPSNLTFLAGKISTAKNDIIVEGLKSLKAQSTVGTRTRNMSKRTERAPQYVKKSKREMSNRQKKEEYLLRINEGGEGEEAMDGHFTEQNLEYEKRAKEVKDEEAMNTPEKEQKMVKNQKERYKKEALDQEIRKSVKARPAERRADSNAVKSRKGRSKRTMKSGAMEEEKTYNFRSKKEGIKNAMGMFSKKNDEPKSPREINMKQMDTLEIKDSKPRAGRRGERNAKNKPNDDGKMEEEELPEEKETNNIRAKSKRIANRKARKNGRNAKSQATKKTGRSKITQNATKNAKKEFDQKEFDK